MHIRMSRELVGSCERFVTAGFRTRIRSCAGVGTQLLHTVINEHVTHRNADRLTCFDKLDDSEKALRKLVSTRKVHRGDSELTYHSKCI